MIKSLQLGINVFEPKPFMKWAYQLKARTWLLGAKKLERLHILVNTVSSMHPASGVIVNVERPEQTILS